VEDPRVDYPTDRRYLTSHEWHKLEGDVCTIGITKFAADELTDITYVELPAPGREVSAGEVVGEIESVKATSELVCAVPGVITEVNEKLADAPELVNNDTHGEGWMVKVKVSDTSAYEGLMTAEAYEAQLDN
jgi:glycine cleavage system H protein